MFPQREFIEVYDKYSIDECERHDPKGLYKMERTQQLKEFTGVSAPYEVLESLIETDRQTVETSILQLVGFLMKRTYL
ncbi:MAG: cysC [Paenibacillus sp.]|jgi:adenylylsulfate kinase|nr:cysC [Paenibacillus sp.]